jgi:hypothetical protein
MSYIKISDPNIIDLAAWQQVVNVVNQHSDTIIAITNNFNSSAATDYSVAGVTHAYDSGSQNILYGREAVNATSTTLVSGSHTGTVTFANTASGIVGFNATPIVTATIQNPNNTANNDLVVSVYNIQPSTFSYKVYRSRQGLATLNSGHSGVTNVVSPVEPVTGTIYINWTAIGPK